MLSARAGAVRRAAHAASRWRRTPCSAAPCSPAQRSFSVAGDGGYLDDTKIPTFHFQASLPKLPVPKLEDTCERYLYAASPLLAGDAAARAATEANVKAFLEGDGPGLQERLVAADKALYSNYVSEPWFDMYLRDRRPLAINYNPQLTFKPDPDAAKQGDQAVRAASLVHSSARFHRTLRDLRLSPDIFHTKPELSKTEKFDLVRLVPAKFSFYAAYLCGAYPLDMSQYGPS